MEKHKGIRFGDDYDYRTFFKEHPNEAYGLLKGDPKAHFLDEYKTSKHGTFSNESRYSGYKSRYNPEGIIGGSWWPNSQHPTAYILSDDQLNKDWDIDYTHWYIKNNEDRPIDVTSSIGIILPSVTIKAKRKNDKN